MMILEVTYSPLELCLFVTDVVPFTNGSAIMALLKVLFASGFMCEEYKSLESQLSISITLSWPSLPYPRMQSACIPA
jgi:hypothetical protein